MNRILFCFFLFFACVGASQPLKAKTLHAILVADTIHADISSVTQPDINRWQKELRVIAKHAQLVLKEKIFSGSDFQKTLVSAYLKSLAVQPEDAVVFFFSGHGYRTREKITPWPFITFEFYKPGLDLNWIADTVRAKKPQFALIMADCCNNYIEHGFGGPSKTIQFNLKSVAPHYPGYLQLFSHAKGCIVVGSCSAGQLSYGSRFGGLYTQCFFSSLHKELLEASPSWKNLLQRTNGYIGHIQKPICEVYR
ncbi:caspase family protein [Candidatus Protochlamydia phocaeensis]|uniref:caspase family protein n=1 Tax=Candidatus Protochlamydia phocaeensis TaxID=1414722 RepID=UPI0008397647|nr:caspase family protein [Candidatus Protochlamydia phocaeensis]